LENTGQKTDLRYSQYTN